MINKMPSLDQYHAILLNHTRKEALYIVEGVDYDTINITKTIQRHVVKDWSFEHNIELYMYYGNLSYSKLENYTELNFVAYNKTADLGRCDCCRNE